MQQNKIFRKVSLDRIASPEQLDHQIRLIPPTGWLAVAALLLLIVATLLWGFYGKIHKKVNGQGVIMYGSGITSVVTQTNGMLTDVGYQVGDFVEKGAAIARVNQDELVRQIEQAKQDLVAVQSVTLESLQTDASNLNYNIYPEFAQLAQQIRVYRAQKEAQSLQAGKDSTDRKNQLAQLQSQVQTLSAQLASARDHVTSYQKLMAYQRKVQLDNATEQTQSSVGLVFTDKSGMYYSRTYSTQRQTVVYDQVGAQYVVLGNASGFLLPVLYCDANGSQQVNASGTYYLPSYAVEVGTSTSVASTSAKAAKVYYSTSGVGYVDPTGTEFVANRYINANNFRQIADSPFFDATLASLESQVESLSAQYSQSYSQYVQLLGSSDEYLKGAVLQADAQIAAFTEQFELTKIIKQQDLQKKLTQLKEQLGRSDEIVAPESGIILELNKRTGDYVQTGQNFCNIIKEDGTTGNQEVILYVSVEQGKKITKGMKVNVSPTTVNREEHGYIVGIVRSVSDYVVSSEHMMRVLNNEQLVRALSGNSAPLEVRVELLRSTQTESGYEWSTTKGAPMKIDAGTICSGEISVQTIRPIDMVVPYLRKLFYSSERDGAEQ